jgi:hypothetical protein
MKPNRLLYSSVITAITAALFLSSCSQAGTQHADATFDTRVKHPAYGPNTTPRVVIDQAHNNFHTASGRYKPFADLIRNDGYGVREGTERFTQDDLHKLDVLVISNAFGPEEARDSTAFASEEIAAVRDWVRSGGSLLLIADHWPCGGAAAKLSEAFGVDMAKGVTEDTVQCAPSTSAAGRREPSTLYFTRGNGLLLDHPITNGRKPEDRVATVETFTGQSLSVPPGATAFLKLSPTASDRGPVIREERVGQDVRVHVNYGDPVSAAGRAQGVALEFGKGRVVILGEAAMMTAQISGEGEAFGMNVPGTDNRKLALNIMHWLSRLD